MLTVIETTADEQLALLAAMNFGHLGCASDDQPYVVPMHYALDGEQILFFTVEGQKTGWLDDNPKVCFQVEKITDERHWQSVIVLGNAARLTDGAEIGRAGKIIFEQHSSLAPAINQTVIGDEPKSGAAAIYSISPTSMSGRKTVKSQGASFVILDEV